MVASKRGAHSVRFIGAPRSPCEVPAGLRCSASDCRRRSDPSTRWRVFWPAATSTVADERLEVPRPVEIVDAGRKAIPRPHGRRCRSKTWPASPQQSESLDEEELRFVGPALRWGGPVASIWTAIHPRLVELIRAHRSTMLFVNSRRTSERLASRNQRNRRRRNRLGPPWLAR